MFEDDPYRDLAYDPCERRPVCARLKSASWIYQGSFSKTMAPGLRIGFLAASADLFPQLVKLKQAADLHTNRFSQWAVLQHLNDPTRQASGLAMAWSTAIAQSATCSPPSMARHLTGLATIGRSRARATGLFFWATPEGGRSTPRRCWKKRP